MRAKQPRAWLALWLVELVLVDWAHGSPPAGGQYPRLPLPNDPRSVLEGGQGNVPKPPPAAVCIVCSEFLGIVPNGGIGTFYTTLAESLTSVGHLVTLLYTQGTRSHHPQFTEFTYWHEHYRAKGIQLLPLPRPQRAQNTGGWHATISYNVLDWLKNHRFDVVHFADWQGHGYHTIMAKFKQVEELSKTTVCLMTHGPLRWARESNNETVDGREDVEVDYMEQQSIKHAQVLISPSNYLLRWIVGKGWELPDHKRVHVQPYIMPQEARRAVEAAVVKAKAAKAAGGEGNLMDETVGVVPPWGGRTVAPDRPFRQVTELVFFGRLEVRKGIVMFCDALDLLTAGASHGAGKLPPGTRITFLGSDRNNVGALNGGDYARQRASRWHGVETQVLTGYDTSGALTYLLDGARVAVLPSLVDNSPLSLLELIGASVPFVASTAGGIPEAIHAADHASVLFPPELHALSAKLMDVLKHGVVVPRSSIAVDVNEQHWIAWHQARAGQAALQGDEDKEL